jgi:serine-type D-Ala-D-Ala carboxypeptidase
MTGKFLMVLACTFFMQKLQANDTIKSSAKVEQFIKDEIKSLKIPGLAVAVLKDGKIDFQKTYGISNIEYQVPVSGETSFQVASVSKLLTSTLVMKMMQDQKLDINSSITKYLDNAPKDWDKITIKHLLSHQSGIPWPSSIGGYIGTKGPGAGEPVSREKIYDELSKAPMAYQPGEKESYIGGDFFILQIILERVGGASFQGVLHNEVFAPLHMNHSGYDDEIRKFPTQVMKPVAGKTQLFTKGKNGPLIYKVYYNPASYASGGLYTSLNDLVNWMNALQKGNYILRSTFEQLATPMPTKGSFTALGWIRMEFNGHIAYGHSGGPGLGDILYFPKEKITIIVLSNLADMLPYMAPAIAKIYMPDILLKEEPKTIERGFDK